MEAVTSTLLTYFQEDSPFNEFLTSLRQLSIALWLLFNAVAKTAVALTKFLFISIKHASPYTKPIFGWISFFIVSLLRSMNQLTWAGKVVLMSITTCTVICIYGLRSGMFRSIGKQCRRLYRRAKRSLHSHWITFSELVSAIVHVVTEVVTIMMPALTIVLPLRFYLTRAAFRRIFTLSTFITSVVLSTKSLMDFYSSCSLSDEVPSNPSSQRTTPFSTGRRSLFDTFVKRESQFERGKRKTIGDFNPRMPVSEASIVTASFQRKFVDRDDGGEWNDSTPMLLSKSAFHPPSSSSEEEPTSVGIKVWLDYWTVASVFDLLITVPISLHRLFFRTSQHSPGINYVMFGYLDEPTGSSQFSLSILLSSFLSPFFHFNLFSARLAPSSSFSSSSTSLLTWRSLAADSYSRTLSLSYDLTYSILLMFVISRKHSYLALARRTLVGILDTVLSALTGLQLIPSQDSVPGFPPVVLQPPKGLLPQMWTLLKQYFPSTVILFFDLLAHIPQILFLMLPSFLLRPAVLLASVFYPIVGSLRALENSGTMKQAYWLTYYTVFCLYETLVMRWFRTTPMWLWLPFRYHLDLLCVTMIQLFSLSPQWITQALLRKVAAPLQPTFLSSPSRSEPQKSQTPNAPPSRRRNSTSATLTAPGPSTPTASMPTNVISPVFMAVTPITRNSSRPSHPVVKEEIDSDDYCTQKQRRSERTSLLPDDTTTNSSHQFSKPITSIRRQRRASATDGVGTKSTPDKEKHTNTAAMKWSGGNKDVTASDKGQAPSTFTQLTRSAAKPSRHVSRSVSNHRLSEIPASTRPSTFVPEAALYQERTSGIESQRHRSKGQKNMREKTTESSLESSGAETGPLFGCKSSIPSNRSLSSGAKRRYPSRKTCNR